MRHRWLSAPIMLALVATSTAVRAESARPFEASRDPAAFERALQCLTEAVYYEARSESEDGQRAVAQVVLNRVRHPAYPNSVCGVVYQGSERTTGCQFSFTCDGSMYGSIDPYSWDRARRIANAALRGSVYRPVGLATHYHTTAIRPYWAGSLVPQVVSGAHIFYRMPGSGSVEAFSQAPSADESYYAPTPRLAVSRETPRSARDRYAPREILEIPVVERQVNYRTVSERRVAGSGPSRTQESRASRSQQEPAAAPRRAGPRVTVQGGVRVARGS